ncbi:MAG: YdcF family protein, partial [Olsenella sp.]
LFFCIWTLTYPLGMPHEILFLGILVGFLGLYVIVTFTALLLYSTFYRIIPKRRDFDFIIIHGAGLMPDGSVTPLLAGRCDKALEVFERGGRTARFIASGGQGADEANSEAQAMCDYLVSKGVPREQVLLEDKSTTTFENMQNSKAIIDRVSAEEGIARPRCVFVTSDYHVLRTATYAMRVGLKADGVGSKTAHYYFPNAFIREYVAIMLRHKGPMIVIVLLWVLGVIISES